MKIKSVPFSWIREFGHRLDTAPYMHGAVETRMRLARLTVHTDHLRDVTAGGMGGIVNAGRITRQWVTDPKFGVRFLSSIDILRSDLSNTSYISHLAVEANPLLIIHQGTTLITRAGTVGRLAYARAEMDGLACTEDVLRVIPDTDNVPSGYLYAFLASRFGLPLVVSGVYGAIIQHIEPEHVADLPVPRFGKRIESEVHELIERAARNRDEAAALRLESFRCLEDSVGLPDMSREGTPLSFATFVVQSCDVGRLDAGFHSPACVRATRSLAIAGPTAALGDVAQVYQTNIFKRPYVDDPAFGYPYYSGSELFTCDPEPRGYLSKRARGIDDYVVHANWLLMQDAGQLGGLIGQVMRVPQNLDSCVVSNHLVRIVANDPADAPYLLTVLRSPAGYRAIVRNAFGSSIPQLESAHLAQIAIPWPDRKLRETIGDAMRRSWDLEDEAIVLDGQAIARVERAVEEAT